MFLRILNLALPALLSLTSVEAGEIQLSSPSDFQVNQRHSDGSGTVLIEGTIRDVPLEKVAFSARFSVNGSNDPMRLLDSKIINNGTTFQATIPQTSGQWEKFELRAVVDGKTVLETSVAHVATGEVFVVAGQSNSANHGEEKQIVQSGNVVNFDGKRWVPANDPQPGASGAGGSFIPPLGDALFQKFNVPIGFITCGIGATSVREWLPKGRRFPNPPTILSRVQQTAEGDWESKGEAYARFIDRLKQLGPQGFRAVLWHQGESDANQKDATRTLPGKLYREHLEAIIQESRKDIGWPAPWFVAQVSYHVPGDEASPDIRDAQASLWKDGIAFEGPDSDALKGPQLRENGGKGVHFSGAGLKAHASAWFNKISPWLEARLSK